MEVTVQIPDMIRQRLGKSNDEIPHWLLEKAGIEAYRSREISGYELRLMLGMTSRIQLDAFLKQHGVHLEHNDEDFIHDAANSQRLVTRQEAFARLCGALHLGITRQSLRDAELDRLDWEGERR